MTIQRNARAFLAFSHDVCAAALAWMALYWLRFNLDLTRALPRATCGGRWRGSCRCRRAIFMALGLYRGLWRFASLIDLQRIVLAAGLGAVLIPVVLVMLQLQSIVPRSVLVLYPVVLIFLMAGSRFAYRVWKEHRLYSPLEALGEPVLIVGRGGGRCTPGQGPRAQPAVARGGIARRRPRPSRAGCCAMSRVLGPIERARRVVRKVRRAQGDHRAAGRQSRGAPPGRRAVRGRRRGGAHGAVVRGPHQRPLGADDHPQRRARRSPGSRPGRARQRGARRVARQPGGDGDRCRRLDRCRAHAPDRPVSPGAARAVRHFRSGAVRNPHVARRYVSATAARDDRRRRQARGAGRGSAGAREAERHLPCGCVQARAADGGNQRLAGGAQQRVRHVGSRARGARGSASRSSCWCRPTRR